MNIGAIPIIPANFHLTKEHEVNIIEIEEQMTERKCFAQLAIGEEHETMLRVTEKWHRSYATSNRMDYVQHYTPYQNRLPRHFDKLWFFADLLNSYDTVFYLDTDSVIMRPDLNILDCAPNFWNSVIWPVNWITTGTLVVKRHNSIMGILEKAKQTDHTDGDYSYDERPINKAFRNHENRKLFTALDDRWNVVGSKIENVFDQYAVGWHLSNVDIKIKQLQETVGLLMENWQSGNAPVSKTEVA